MFIFSLKMTEVHVLHQSDDSDESASVTSASDQGKTSSSVIWRLICEVGMYITILLLSENKQY